MSPIAAGDRTAGQRATAKHLHKPGDSTLTQTHMLSTSKLRARHSCIQSTLVAPRYGARWTNVLNYYRNMQFCHNCLFRYLAILSQRVPCAICCQQHGCAAEAIRRREHRPCRPCEPLSCDDVHLSLPANPLTAALIMSCPAIMHPNTLDTCPTISARQ